ncbi:MAG TPA: hypothetical protein PLT49_07685 [Ferruginibacter sp.]|nr:hypothetical protein [Ferruginibacter sp.]HNF43534.1 hypothetical protein [Ferruginibacter sp.]HNK28962.1 hypothetical protein [Ferruginibacter sp.]
MRRLLILTAFIGLSLAGFAQETNKNPRKSRKEEKRAKINAMIRMEEEGVIAYRKHFLFGIKLISDGYGIFFEKGYAKSVRRATLFQLEISERKHQKEEKQSNPLASTAPLIYGKINYFYPVKLGAQLQFLLGNKSNKNGVSITGNIGGGLCIGLLRPYEVEVDKNGERTYVRYESEDSTLFINGPYYGGPNLGKGWNHLKVTPGLYVKPALRFDYGRFNDLVSALEVGVTAEYYTKKIPQMVYNKQRQFFFGAYVAVEFGKRK